MGVDLGTTFSAAATVDDSGVPAMVGLGNRAMQIPSVLFVGADGEVLVGEPAERRARNDPTRIVREFKRRMGDSVAIYLGGKPFPIEQLTARLLRWVIDQTTERMGEAPTRLTLTHPAAWAEFNVGKLRKAAEIAGFPDVTMCPEPVAAAFQHARSNHVDIGDRICIYDLGGGTFDVCVVQKTADGFEILGTPSGLDPLGGIDFDKLVIDRINDELSLLDLEADPEDAGWWRLGRDCVDAKEALSTDVDVSIPIAIGGLSTALRLTRSEFESMIDEKLDATIGMTQRVLRSAGLTSAELTALVLVGGSSRIPLVSEKLAGTFHCPLALNTHPKHEVALGAALAGRPAIGHPAPGRPVAGHPAPGRPAAAGLASDAPARTASAETAGRNSHRAARVRPARSARRWRRPTLISAGITAVVATVLFGGGWLAAPGSMDTARASGPLGQPGTSATAVTETTATPSAGPTNELPTSELPTSKPTTDAPATPAPTTDPANTPIPTTDAPRSPETPAAATTDAVPPTMEVPPTVSTAVPPATLDAASVAWLRVQCNSGFQLKQAMVTQTKFRNVLAAQQAFVASYTRQATIAGQTADALGAMEPGLIADGRIDAAAAVAGWQLLKDVLTEGAQEMANLTPQTTADIDAANEHNNARLDERNYSPADLSRLTPAETAFVGTMPGCEGLIAHR